MDHLRIGRVVISTMRQPANAPLWDSAIVRHYEEGFVVQGGRRIETRVLLWRAAGVAVRLFTPPYETQPLALVIAVVGGPMPPSLPVLRQRFRTFRRRCSPWLGPDRLVSPPATPSVSAEDLLRDMHRA